MIFNFRQIKINLNYKKINIGSVGFEPTLET